MVSPTLEEDTLEIQLSPEDLLGLLRASDMAQLAAANATPILTPTAPPAAPARTRLQRGSVKSIGHASWRPVRQWSGAAVCYGIFILFAWWGSSVMVGPQNPSATVMKSANAAVAAQPMSASTLQAPAVRIANPFDATEVFEFPAGTSDADSRAKVADMLLQRARERRSQWADTKPKETLLAAKS
jgi:hypothetical protein